VMRARPPHLAIVDCAMPGLSGVELVRAMRGDGRLCGVPVLMLTGRQSEADEVLAFSAGADDYLRKPADLDQLVGRVDALLYRAAKERAA
ncbi:MAG: response regulator, partial [Sphingomicrobium sp.]